MPFLVNFSPWKSLAWASAAVFSPPGQHAKPPSQRLPRCHDESCGMFHRGTHWRTAFPLFDALRKCINAEMPGESNRNQKHTIHTQKHTTLQTQQERMDDDGCFFGAWSKETYPMRRSEWTMATACHVLKVDKLDKQRRKGLKGNGKKYVLSYANVCYCMF